MCYEQEVEKLKCSGSEIEAEFGRHRVERRVEAENVLVSPTMEERKRISCKQEHSRKVTFLRQVSQCHAMM